MRRFIFQPLQQLSIPRFFTRSHQNLYRTYVTQYIETLYFLTTNEGRRNSQHTYMPLPMLGKLPNQSNFYSTIFLFSVLWLMPMSHCSHDVLKTSRIDMVGSCRSVHFQEQPQSHWQQTQRRWSLVQERWEQEWAAVLFWYVSCRWFPVPCKRFDTAPSSQHWTRMHRNQVN